MSDNEQATSSPIPPTVVADLARILSQASEGSAAYDQSIAWANQQGKTDLAEFFQQMKQGDQARVRAAVAQLELLLPEIKDMGNIIH